MLDGMVVWWGFFDKMVKVKFNVVNGWDFLLKVMWGGCCSCVNSGVVFQGKEFFWMDFD